MVTWSQAAQWDPSSLLTAYDDFNKREEAMETAGTDLYHASGKLKNTGEAADAARSNLDGLRKRSDQIEALMTDLMSCTRVASTGVEQVQQAVEEAVAYAAAEGLDISDGGYVEIQSRVIAAAKQEAHIMEGLGVKVDFDETPIFHRAKSSKAQLESAISKLLKLAEDTDRTYTEALNAIAGGYASHESTVSADDSISISEKVRGLQNERSVSDARGAWDALSPDEQQEAIDKFPQEVGSTNGVPFEDRVKANNHNIDSEISELDKEIKRLNEQVGNHDVKNKWYTPFYNESDKKDDSIRERIRQLEDRRDYYQSLRDGDGAVLFNPDNNQIIEVAGDMSQGTNVKEVVTFVSGTNTNIDGVRSYSSMPKYLVEQGQAAGKPTVGFNFYDGRFHGENSWITWTGEHANSNNGHVSDLGGNLSGFQEALAQEDISRNSDNNAIGHSAGHSVVAASENAKDTGHGTYNSHYDNVHSLSGSYMTEGWKPSATTDYDHYAYNGEPIHVISVAKDTPNESATYEQHRSSFGEIPKHARSWHDRFNPVDAHTRTARTDDKNLPVMQNLTHEIFKD